MKNSSDTQSNSAQVTRREALLRTLKGSLAAAIAAPAIAQAAPVTPTFAAKTEFFPENDYPYFGADLPSGVKHG